MPVVALVVVVGLVLLVLLLAALFISRLPREDWPKFRGPFGPWRA